MWSDFLVPNLNPATNATITTATFVGTPKLHLEYISPQINQPIPSVTFYPLKLEDTSQKALILL